MSLNDAIEAELPFLRAEAESRMTDTCRITRPGDGEPVFNPETGQYDDPAPVITYEGKCRISPRQSGASASTATAGDASWQVGEFPLHLPAIGSELVRVGHTVTYLTAKHDPALVGNTYGITVEPDLSQATARRFRMKRIVGN